MEKGKQSSLVHTCIRDSKNGMRVGKGDVKYQGPGLCIYNLLSGIIKAEYYNLSSKCKRAQFDGFYQRRLTIYILNSVMRTRKSPWEDTVVIKNPRARSGAPTQTEDGGASFRHRKHYEPKYRGDSKVWMRNAHELRVFYKRVEDTAGKLECHFQGSVLIL